MSLRYKGAVISATPPTTTPGNSGTAPGSWTLQQQMQAQAAGTWPSFVPLYIEDVFSTYLYTGNGSTQTITNGIDLAGKGGLVWVKSRDVASGHFLYDTSRGVNQYLASNTTAASANYNSSLTAFNSNGFTLGFNLGNVDEKYASWTFRKQPKFFDVVTYTGDSTNNRQISHSLGATPGCIIIKIINGNNSWIVWHNSLPTQAGELNATGSFLSAYYTNLLNGAPTSTTFTVSHNGFNTTNETGYTYVAYLFAHNAGGFGLTGTDNVISCGSFTTDGSGYIPTVNLGYEPQWVLAKPSSGTGNWFIMDNMRGWYNQQADQGNALFPNTSGAEAAGYNAMIPTATGFTGPAINFGAGITYIYIAIRRGPMKTPTSGTSVFVPYTYTGDGASTRTFSIGLNPVDMVWQACRSSATYNYNTLTSRLQGTNGMTTAGIGAEFVSNQAYDVQTGIRATGFENTLNQSGQTFVMEGFRRAPGFFDEVCYTGTGSARTVAHNLGVAPELMIIKVRTPGGYAWRVYAAPLGVTQSLVLNTADASETDTYWNGTAPTSTVFSVNDYGQVNNSGSPIVAYLFASCPSVSKVGSYTGNGSSQTINCGFTGGARFVMIKRTDSTGNWFVWDTARGMVAGTDPRLGLNLTTAEVNNNFVYTDASGFQIVTTDANVNASGGSYIFLAIA